MENIKLVIGTIAYGELTAKYLPYFFDTLKDQTFRDYKLIVIDNTETEDNPNKEFITKNYPEIEVKWAGGNIGFARAFNLMIARAEELNAEFFLALNPDMIFRPDAIEKMLTVIEGDPNLASVSPKVLRWDFKSNFKTKTIDTCGIVMRPGLRFADLGQAEADEGQYDQAEILGPSGCAALYRLSALEKVACMNSSGKKEYFDELMFMYKEDCDMAYRLNLAGFGSKLVPEAVVYHDRTAEGQGESDVTVALNRMNKSRAVKTWSFKNQQIIFFKYWRLQNFKNKLAVIWYEIKMLSFILLFERYLLKEFKNLWEIKKEIKKS